MKTAARSSIQKIFAKARTICAHIPHGTGNNARQSIKLYLGILTERSLKRAERPAKKRKKRRFPIVTAIFLGVLALLSLISLIGPRSASAAPVRATQAASAKAVLDSNPTNPVPSNADGSCPSGTVYGSAETPDTIDGTNTLNLACYIVIRPPGANNTCEKYYSFEKKMSNCYLEWIFEPLVAPSLTYSCPSSYEADLSQGYSGLCVLNKGLYDGFFYCASLEVDVAKDWLAGDGKTETSGHLQTTTYTDTLDGDGVTRVYPYIEGVSIGILSLVIIFIGYRMLLAATGFSYASAISALSRLIVGVAAIAVSFYIIRLLIDSSNTLSYAIVLLHGAIHPSDARIGFLQFSYSADVFGEPATSFRGIVSPIVRWGCAGNDFGSILSSSFWSSTMGSIFPIFGGFITLAGTVNDAQDFVKYSGEFIQTLLSISLGAQVLFRIIMLNFYILIAPAIFACWGIPGKTGSAVVESWLKGFCGTLFMQAAQLFVLTVIPLIIPDLSHTNIPTDSYNLLAQFIPHVPVLIVLWLTIRIPKMLGGSAAKTIAAAGSVASGATAAASMAAYSMVAK